MKIKLILFDFFGTLAFIPQNLYLKFFHLWEKFGYNFDLKDLKKKAKGTFFDLVGLTKNWEDATKFILLKFGQEPEKKAVKEISQFLKENLIFRFYKDTKVIKKLPFRKAILTTAPRFFLSNLQFVGFEKIFTPTDLKIMKPDPKAFLTTLETLRVSPEETLMVSNDLERDILPAKKLGMAAILIDRQDSFKNYSGRKIKSLNELKEIIFKYDSSN